MKQLFKPVDPLASMYPSISPYAYVANNPVNWIDPTGMSIESTHTDRAGNIIEVYDDGDNSVYRHNDIDPGQHVDGKRSLVNQRRDADGSTGGGGEKMGDTEYWDEFVSPETRTAMTGTQIEFGSSWHSTLNALATTANSMNLKEIAEQSKPGKDFDVKSLAGNVDKGRMLNGKYASARSAGNYLAGYNAQGGTMYGVSISFTTFQQLAGRLHAKGSVSNADKASIVLFGTPVSGKAPTWGEEFYQYRRSKAGWDARAGKN